MITFVHFVEILLLWILDCNVSLKVFPINLAWIIRGWDQQEGSWEEIEWYINLQSLEDTQVGYISQKYTLDE